MAQTYVSAELRRQIVARAGRICEYCLIAETDTFLGCQVDHIISEKHGGPTEVDNLAYACASRNRAKGSDIASIDWETRELVRLFNPRTDQWREHFALVGNKIEALTKIGAVTSRILDFNSVERLLERGALRAGQRYPSAGALDRINGS